MVFACLFTCLLQALVDVAYNSDPCKSVVSGGSSGKCVWHTGSTQLVVSTVLFVIAGVTILLVSKEGSASSAAPADSEVEEAGSVSSTQDKEEA